MGAGGGEVELAAGGGEENLQAALAEATWVKPFKCSFERCKQFLPNGVSQAYVNWHMATHRELRKKANEKEAEKEAERTDKLNAAGPSALKRLNRQKDTAPDQRSGAKAGESGKGAKGSKGKKGKGKSNKGKAAAGGGRRP